MDCYFEYSLVSYITNENIDLMKQLMNGNEITINEARVMVQEYFSNNKRTKRLSDESDQDDDTKTELTPDVFIKHDTKTWIIDAYNGANLASIREKINLYKGQYPEAFVYIFASDWANINSLTFGNKQAFSIYHLDDQDKCVETSTIDCPIAIDIDEINRRYVGEYRLFNEEIVYWINCFQEESIRKSSD